MKANSRCMSCILSKQEKEIRTFSGEAEKSAYLHQVLGILYEYGQTESTPQIAERLDRAFEAFWGTANDYTPQKRQYNRLLLSLEKQIDEQIKASGDVIRECIKYVCAANYIDFSAVEHVNEDTFGMLLEKAGKEKVDQTEYDRFLTDLGQAKRLAYLTDNCGEIVLDKLLIRYIKEKFPKLQITAVVRGSNVLNDATLEDAREVGLTRLVPCIGNGNAAPGTVPARLGKEAGEVLAKADVIIAKGQGNFESLYGEGFDPYYLFLCKCGLFVSRFGLERYASVFAKEERIRRMGSGL